MRMRPGLSCAEHYFLDAAESGNLKEAQSRVRFGASPNARELGGANALHLAAAAGRASMCAWLLEAGCDPDAATNLGKTPVSIACEAGKYKTCAVLAPRSSLNRASVATPSPLSIAAQKGDIRMAKLLIRSGADPAFCHEAGADCAFYAARRPDARMLDWLLGLGIGKGLDKPGHNLLYNALLEGADECARLLIHKGFEPQKPFDCWPGAASLCAMKCSFETLRDLFCAFPGASLEPDAAGRNALHALAFSSKPDPRSAELLIQKGACISEPDLQGLTPLDLAFERGTLDALLAGASLAEAACIASGLRPAHGARARPKL